jgi:biotin transport system substrate-specific component
MASVYNLKQRAISITSSERISGLLKISAFTSLMILSAKVEIPTQPVPFTLQTMFVLLAGAMLGKKAGALSQIFYLAIGIAGIPVFAGPVAGFAKILGPTGGYLIAFPIAAFITGWFFEKSDKFSLRLIGLFSGLFVIYFLGVLFLNTIYIHNMELSIKYGLTAFSGWEIVKIFAAGSICRLFKK